MQLLRSAVNINVTPYAEQFSSLLFWPQLGQRPPHFCWETRRTSLCIWGRFLPPVRQVKIVKTSSCICLYVTSRLPCLFPCSCVYCSDSHQNITSNFFSEVSSVWTLNMLSPESTMLLFERAGRQSCGCCVHVLFVILTDLMMIILFSFTGSIGPPSCVAEVTQWVLTREQVGKVGSQSYTDSFDGSMETKSFTINLLKLVYFLSIFLHASCSISSLQFEFGWVWIKICVCVVRMRQTQTAVRSHCVSWRRFRCLPVWTARLRHRCWSRPRYMPCWCLLLLDLVIQKELVSHHNGSC